MSHLLYSTSWFISCNMTKVFFFFWISMTKVFLFKALVCVHIKSDKYHRVIKNHVRRFPTRVKKYLFSFWNVLLSAKMKRLTPLSIARYRNWCLLQAHVGRNKWRDWRILHFPGAMSHEQRRLDFKMVGLYYCITCTRFGYKSSL